MLSRESTEKCSGSFAIDGILTARKKSWECLDAISQALEPEVSEVEAVAIAKKICQQEGSSKAWHLPKIRFDEGTLKTFSEPQNPDSKLRSDSVLFIDLGPVFDGYEGDVGATFAMPQASPERADIALAAEELFHTVAAHWRSVGSTGKALYRFAEKAARERGYELNPRVDGHRVSDFPHAVYFKGGVAEIDFKPAPGLWILEIKIRHPTLEFGAFYEDLLLENQDRPRIHGGDVGRFKS